SVAVMELKLDSFFDIKTSNIKMNGISKFPFVKRDIALLLDKEVPVKDLLKTIRQIDRNLIRDCEVFDVYEGIAIGPGRKSVAISIAFQSENRTLKDEEVNELEKKIKSELVAKFKAVLRS
ncbi:MAG: phenylalanine--tRNA ligase subunit beta, partial [Erysipelotrichia bacterium]|nr:phenylalanine--tRNA ligase subunit beta [Erysipelotrichia bacterium]